MSKTRTEVVKTGVTFGAVLAIVISWSYNHSVLWAIAHGFLSWIYVVYHIFFHYQPSPESSFPRNISHELKRGGLKTRPFFI